MTIQKNKGLEKVATKRKNVVKRIFSPFYYLLLFIMLYVIVTYIVTPIYIFPDKTKFSGNAFYNPYKEISENSWIKGNYHMHSKVWGGITNGAKTSDTAIWELYNKLGISSIAISNYQKISKLNNEKPEYIPCYEHGYGIYKNHHLCLGAEKVVWYDVVYKQNIHQKQHIINKLKKHTELLSINHPAFHKGFKPEDFHKLTNYHFIGALNGYKNSIECWDAALSAGRPAFILADDDMHDISNANEPARRFMLINSDSNKREDVFKALEKGNSIGVYMLFHNNENDEKKAKRLSEMALPIEVAVRNDSLVVCMNADVIRFEFIGQDGKLLFQQDGGAEAKYKIEETDTYIRVVVIEKTEEFDDGLQLFFNPIIRTNSPDSIPQMPDFQTNTSMTWLLRGGLAIILILILAIYIKKKNKKNLPQ